MTRLLAMLLLFCLHAAAAGQSEQNIGFELQVYPTGMITGVSYEVDFHQRSQAYLRFGGNFFDHGDLGVQEEERGFGFGFTFGYKRFFKATKEGWRFALKNDLWSNQVKWNNPSLMSNGETQIFVVQPTAELSHVWRTEKGYISPSFAFGFEWNVKTVGEPTGEGAILLLGIQLVRAL